MACSSSIRFFAISKYFSSISMPMKLRFVRTQATPVVPLPRVLFENSIALVRVCAAQVLHESDGLLSWMLLILSRENRSTAFG